MALPGVLAGLTVKKIMQYIAMYLAYDQISNFLPTAEGTLSKKVMGLQSRERAAKKQTRQIITTEERRKQQRGAEDDHAIDPSVVMQLLSAIAGGSSLHEGPMAGPDSENVGTAPLRAQSSTQQGILGGLGGSQDDTEGLIMALTSLADKTQAPGIRTGMLSGLLGRGRERSQLTT